MILHPGILALLLGSSSVLLFTLIAAGFGLRVLRHWDPASASEWQLRLERQTYLISTLMNYAMAIALGSALLFVVTADDLHGLLVGAMCATGSLNANPVGWAVLWAKLALLFGAGLWIAVNQVDGRCEDTPYTRRKYLLLLALVPLITADWALQLRYFLGLHPDIITSCCGSLFTPGDAGIASTLASLPPRPTMGLFYGSAGLLLALGGIARRPGARVARPLFASACVVWLGIALAGIVAFVAPYIYQLPTHHCPFDVFQAGYGYAGYPLFLSLFGGVLFGGLPGWFQLLGRPASAAEVLPRLERRWVGWSLACTLLFLGLASYPVWMRGVRLYRLG